MESTSTAAWVGPDEIQVAAKDRSHEKLFQEKEEEFMNDARLVKMKMHRYPLSIQVLGDWCTVPKVVAIGPYNHGHDHLLKAEKMKLVAVQYCIQEYKKFNNNAGLSVLDLNGAVYAVAAEVYVAGLYEKDVVAGIGYEQNFLPMMFYDTCFLVMYILKRSGVTLDRYLYDFFEANDNDILHDIMLLENQILLQVVDAVLKMFTAEPLERMRMFIAMWLADGVLQDRADLKLPDVDLDSDNYNIAPHLLGLLRFYAVGKRSKKPKLSLPYLKKMESMPFSAGAIELAEMGIFLTVTANKTMKLPDMGLLRKWIIFARLSMAPLFLNYARASWLVNMAALELCTTPDFFDREAEFEDSAVCSYLLLLCMLMDREEDVYELRKKGILRGGGGFNNKQIFDFFTSLQNLRKGRSIALVMLEISGYWIRRRYIIAVYAFVCNNWKYIIAVSSALGVFIGIIKALMNLKGAH